MKRYVFRFLSLLPLLAIVLAMASCNRNKFRIEGSVAGAADSTLYLERSDFAGKWMPVDSVSTSGDGDFSISMEAPESPEIFRLRMGNRYIYLPVDSTENLTVSSTAAGFGRDFTVKGSAQAERMARFDLDLVKIEGASAEQMKQFKRKVFNDLIFQSRGSVASYYVLTKTVDGKPLFSVSDPDDAPYYAAVATAFKQFRPDDPRTAMLEKLALEARRNRRASKGQRQVIQAGETAIIDIALPDAEGRERKLSDLTGKSPVLVIFNRLDLSNSPAVTMKLRELYGKYGARVAFYQVCLDPDLYSWREAAENIPWTVVRDARGEKSPVVATYNVVEIPEFFIYNASGELSKRVRGIADLDAELSAL